MKLFRSDQIKLIDEHTINDEPIESVDLMERAAIGILNWYLPRFDRTREVCVLAGPGNNGGDGLALARLLFAERYICTVYYINFTEKTSSDWQRNKQRLDTETGVIFRIIESAEDFPLLSGDEVIIDAIFGSGLSRPADGLAAEIIRLINSSDAVTVSIDIPSGLFGEDNSTNSYESIVRADFTVSFQFPKISFMFPENEAIIGELHILPIGLSEAAINDIATPFSLSEKTDVSPLLKTRNKFDHKGIYGHGLLIAGSFGRMGAAVISAEAALRSGIGLLSCHIPACGVVIVQTSVREAMVLADKNDNLISGTGDISAYDAIGIGPGLGVDPLTCKAVYELLKKKKRMVMDADAINILSLNKDWLQMVPEGSILTPHPKEFERLAGKTDNSFMRLDRQTELAQKLKSIVILKGANTSIATPDGKVYFNSTGNPGMATAGSGDALTGILLSLLAQGYSSANAAILGVYLHGLAGDLAAADSSYESIIASDIINHIGKAFTELRKP